LCENVPEELCTLNGRREEQFYPESDGRWEEGVIIGVDTCEWY
jgi:hypothetical protein